MATMTFDSATQNGLRPRADVPNNSQYLAECKNYLPTERGLVPLILPSNPVTVGGFAPTVTWPYPQLLRGERSKILLAFGSGNHDATIYEISPTAFTATALHLVDARIPANDKNVSVNGGLWHIAAFQDFWFLTNGYTLVYSIPSNSGKYVHTDDTVVHVATVANIGNRLVMGGFTGTYFATDTWKEIVDYWLKSSGGDEREDLVTSLSDKTGGFEDWVLVSRRGGGAIDYPFVSTLAALGIFETALATYAALKETIITDIEEGALILFRCALAGSIKKIIPLGNDFVVYGSRAVSLLRVGEGGCREEVLVEHGVYGRGGACGDNRQHVFVTNGAMLYRIQNGQAPELLDRAEFIAGLTEANVSMTYDPLERYAWICDGTTGYCITRTGVGQSHCIQPTSIIRVPGLDGDDDTCIGISKILVAAGDIVGRVQTHPFDGGQVGIIQTTSVRIATTDTNITTDAWTAYVNWRTKKSSTFTAGAAYLMDLRGVARVKQTGREFNVLLTTVDRAKAVDLERIEVEMDTHVGSKPGIGSLIGL
jgi:hypothetical protein